MMARPDGEDALASIRNEAFRKLGRNVVLFQQLEYVLKAFVSTNTFGGSSETEVAKSLELRRRALANKSLGDVVSSFRKDVLGKPGPTAELVAPAMASFSVDFHVEGDEYVAHWRSSLQRVLGERNRLMHHLVQDFDLWTREGIDALDSLLDPQAERIRQQIEAVKQLSQERTALRLKLVEQVELSFSELFDEPGEGSPAP